MLRRAGAILAGLLVTVVPSVGTDAVLHASGIFPPLLQPMDDALWALAIAYRIVYAIAGGYVTARLAPDRPMAHALALGIIGIALGVAGAVSTWNEGPAYGPKWFSLGLVVSALPCTCAGSAIRTRISGGPQ